jgi:hypothetical protein
VTIEAWLHARVPAPPERLATRIASALGARRSLHAEVASATCLDAAESLLQELMARPSAGRESALDLLTVDALVTYAFEAAATAPASLESTAAAAMVRLAATASA